MASRTLLGLPGGDPCHWRADRASSSSFAPLARTLRGMERDRDEAELEHLDDGLTSIAMAPNPNRDADGPPKGFVAGADPARGAQTFATGTPRFLSCGTCHASPAGAGAASRRNLVVPRIASCRVRTERHFSRGAAPRGDGSSVQRTP